MSPKPDAREPVILSAVRTPMGRYQGALSPLSATRLGAIVVRAADGTVSYIPREEVAPAPKQKKGQANKPKGKTAP